MSKTVADQFVEMLAAAGVKRICYAKARKALDQLAAGSPGNALSLRSRLPRRSATTRRATLSSPAASAYRPYQPHAIWRLTASEAVLSGRGDEIIDLARSNLWR